MPAAVFVWTLLFSGVAGTLLVNPAKANFEPPPTYIVQIISPESKTYTVRNMALVFEMPNTEHTFSILEAKIVVDGAILFYFYNNASYGLYYASLINLSEGTHYVEASWRSEHPFDTGGTYRVAFVIDVTPLKVAILKGSVISVQNRTYNTTDVSLNFTVNQPPPWIGYSLDGKANVTITESTSQISYSLGHYNYRIVLAGLSEGSHSLTVYAKDDTDNIGKSETLHFTVAQETQPQETEPESQPSNPEPFPTTLVAVAVAVIMATVCFGLAAYFVKFKKKAAKP